MTGIEDGSHGLIGFVREFKDSCNINDGEEEREKCREKFVKERGGLIVQRWTPEKPFFVEEDGRKILTPGAKDVFQQILKTSWETGDSFDDIFEYIYGEAPSSDFHVEEFLDQLWDENVIIGGDEAGSPGKIEVEDDGRQGVIEITRGAPKRPKIEVEQQRGPFGGMKLRFSLPDERPITGIIYEESSGDGKKYFLRVFVDERVDGKVRPSTEPVVRDVSVDGYEQGKRIFIQEIKKLQIPEGKKIPEEQETG